MDMPLGIDDLKRLADNVEKAIMNALPLENAGDVVGMGADGTPTSAVDSAADAALLHSVEEMGLEVDVLSEETGFVDRGFGWTLIVDPLDGTYNALRGSGPYAISLAVGQNDLSGVVAGLVRDLKGHEDYHAVLGEGAFLDGKKLHVGRFSPEDSVFSIYLGSMATARCHAVAKAGAKVRYMGCVAVEMCMVASGALDMCFVESVDMGHNPRISDVAAGWIIVKEAGGFVLNSEKQPFNMGLYATERSSMLAAGDKRILEVI